MVVGSVIRGERNDRVGQWVLSPVVRRAAVAEVGGTPLFDASERPHRRQDNLRGSIANSLPAKLAPCKPGGTLTSNDSAPKRQNPRATGRIFASCGPISRVLNVW